MRFVLPVLFLILSFIICPKVHSLPTYYFDFNISNLLIADEQEIPVNFIWNADEYNIVNQKRYVVKPRIANGAVWIFNDEKNKYVGVSDLFSDLPYLKSKMTIKFTGIKDVEISKLLSFDVYDTIEGQTYVTPQKELWGINYGKNYIDVLNENLTSYSILEKEEFLQKTDVVLQYSNPLKIYLWYLGPAAFLLGLLKFRNGFG